MKKTKYNYFSTIDKEEAWLNNMLQEGWKLTSPVGYGQYKFVPNSKANQVIRIDARTFKQKKDREAYLQFIEDSGWKHIKSSGQNGKWYFIGELRNSDELFSDNQSKYEREVRSKKRLDTTNGLIMMYYILFFYSSNDTSVLFNMKKAFLTPNIWHKQGEDFTRAFLFELPFAIIRVFFAFAPLILLAYLIYQSVLVRRSINRYKERL